MLVRRLAMKELAETALNVPLPLLGHLERLLTRWIVTVGENSRIALSVPIINLFLITLAERNGT